MAIATSTNTGSTVHRISTVVLCVVRDGNRVALLAEAPHDEQHQSEHEGRDDENDDVDVVVQPNDVVCDRGDRLLKVDLLGRWLAGAGKRRRRNQARARCDSEPCKHAPAQAPLDHQASSQFADPASPRRLGRTRHQPQSYDQPRRPRHIGDALAAEFLCSGTARRFTKHTGRRGLKGTALRHKVALLCCRRAGCGKAKDVSRETKCSRANRLTWLCKNPGDSQTSDWPASASSQAAAFRRRCAPHRSGRPAASILRPIPR